MNLPTVNTRASRIAFVQALVLMVLCVLVFRNEYPYVYRQVLSNPETAPVLALPMLIGILLYRRWDSLKAGITNGSIWGLVLILFALAMFTLASWPFNYGYPRLVALVLALAGALLASGGWRVLKLCAPMLLLLLICLPIGPRIYARLIIVPEIHTLQVAQALLDMLPGVFVNLNGPDLSYVSSKHGSGTIALGEPHRGASLFMAYTVIGIFATFLRFRPPWQIVAMTIFAIPVALVCNLMRVLIYGVVTIYGHRTPLDPAPRYASIVGSLLLAYGIWMLLLTIMNQIIAEPRDQPSADNRAGVTVQETQR